MFKTCSFNGGVGALVVRVQNAGVAAEDVSFYLQFFNSLAITEI